MTLCLLLSILNRPYYKIQGHIFAIAATIFQPLVTYLVVKCIETSAWVTPRLPKTRWMVL